MNAILLAAVLTVASLTQASPSLRDIVHESEKGGESPAPVPQPRPQVEVPNARPSVVPQQEGGDASGLSQPDSSGAQPHQAPGPSEPGRALCLPPGVPPLETLHSAGQESFLTASTTAGGRVPARLVRKTTEQGALFIFYWIPTGAGWALAAVDDHPDAPIPVLVDSGLIDAGGRVITDGASSCHWLRLGGERL